MDKRTLLRQQIRSRRQTISLEEQQIASQAVADLIVQTDMFKNSQHIAGYMAYQGEIDPMPIFKAAWKLGKTCYLPVVQAEKKMVFVRYDLSDQLKPNQFNILEPALDASKIIDPQALDLVLVPLIAFDKQGHRLGMGSGYYDFNFAFLCNAARPSHPQLIGLAYEWQCCKDFSVENWDVKLDAVVTKQMIYKVL